MSASANGNSNNPVSSTDLREEIKIEFLRLTKEEGVPANQAATLALKNVREKRGM